MDILRGNPYVLVYVHILIYLRSYGIGVFAHKLYLRWPRKESLLSEILNIAWTSFKLRRKQRNRVFESIVFNVFGKKVDSFLATHFGQVRFYWISKATDQWSIWNVIYKVVWLERCWRVCIHFSFYNLVKQIKLGRPFSSPKNSSASFRNTQVVFFFSSKPWCYYKIFAIFKAYITSSGLLTLH